MYYLVFKRVIVKMEGKEWNSSLAANNKKNKIRKIDLATHSWQRIIEA